MSSAASVEPKPGFAVCRSCDPPRHVPSGEVMAHLTEHHLSVSEIDHAEVFVSSRADNAATTAREERS